MIRPTVTIIIPTYNRPDRLDACVRAIAKLRYPTEQLSVEIIDDGSDVPLAMAAAAACPFAVRVTRQRNRGPAAARNAGAQLASGALLAFTDDDCTPEPDWIAALARGYLAAPDALLGGTVKNGLVGNVFAEASQDLVDFIYKYYGASEGGAPFFTSNNLACDRTLFVAAGGFDESFPLAAAEDREIGLRWRREGRPLHFVADAVIRHFHNLDLRRFWRQHTNYGRGARHLHKVLRAARTDRPRLEKIGFYARLVSHPMKARPIAGVPRSALMLLSQIAMAKGFARG